MALSPGIKLAGILIAESKACSRSIAWGRVRVRVVDRDPVDQVAIGACAVPDDV
jgi:hypothetical protein